MFQSITIVGNLGADPIMRYTPSGVPVTNFDVATSRKWTDANGQPQEKTIWFRVATWRKQAETCAQYLAKGSKVLVIGEIEEPKVFTTKNGENKAALEITAQTVKFLSSKSENGASEPAVTAYPASSGGEEVPF